MSEDEVCVRKGVVCQKRRCSILCLHENTMISPRCSIQNTVLLLVGVVCLSMCLRVSVGGALCVNACGRVYLCVCVRVCVCVWVHDTQESRKSDERRGTTPLVCVCVCVCVCVRLCVCLRSFVCARESLCERESVCDYMWLSESECECVCVCVWIHDNWESRKSNVTTRIQERRGTRMDESWHTYK